MLAGGWVGWTPATGGCAPLAGACDGWTPEPAAVGVNGGSVAAAWPTPAALRATAVPPEARTAVTRTAVTTMPAPAGRRVERTFLAGVAGSGAANGGWGAPNAGWLNAGWLHAGCAGCDGADGGAKVGMNGSVSESEVAGGAKAGPAGGCGTPADGDWGSCMLGIPLARGTDTRRHDEHGLSGPHARPAF